MAFIIENTFFSQEDPHIYDIPQQDGKPIGQRLIWSCQQRKAFHFRKKEGTKTSRQCIQSSPPARYFMDHIEPHIFVQSTHLGVKICANLIKDGRLIRLLGGRSLEILKLFTKCNNFLPFDGYCLMLDNRTGLLEIHSTQMFTHISGQKGVKKITIQLIEKIDKMIRQQMAIMLDLVDEGYHCEAREKDKRYYERVMGEGAETLKMRQLISISHLDVKLLEKSVAERSILVKALTDFLVNRNKNVGMKGSLFGHQANLYRICAQNDYFSTRPMSLQSFNNQFTRQYDAYQPRIIAPENIDKRDNIFLFNTIRIRNAHLVNLEQPHCEGGFSKIFISRLEFEYTQSTNPVFDIQNNNPRCTSRNKWAQVQPSNIPYLSKLLAIKVNKKESDYDKIAHQKKIVQHFRVESSPYLVKYYHSVQKHFAYRRYLLMDFMGNVPTLSQFNHLHQQSFSLNSKMHILIHLSAALKFLSSHNVVHMDLSSLNVVVVHRLLTKIIDFGEAYHPILDKDSPNNYNPGHTMPYAPPETFQPLKKFACSSDMFSFGIILFRLITNSFPFAPSQQLKGEYERKTYMRRFMFAPQKMAQLGWNKQNRLLMLLVERCLRQDEAQRPIPYWLCAILTKVFQSLR